MGKPSERAMRRRRLRRSAALPRRLASGALAALIALPAPVVLAGPQDGKIVAGEATIQYGVGEIDRTVPGVDSWTVVNQTSQRAASQWSSLDTAANEGMRIIQPDPSSAILLQVLDSAATQYNGAMLADGNVHIANPNGIYFGGKALIDVGSLFAVAGRISNEHFMSGGMAGENHFTGIEGEVRVEEGARLHAGSSIALLGQKVANHGHVTAEDGLLVMAAGEEIILAKHGSPILVKLSASAGEAVEGPAVENTGTLDAGRGRVRMAAGDLVSLAVRNTGTVRAKRIEIAGGEGGLVEVSGALDATDTREGERGGRIEVVGDFIELKGARLDASGEAGGGDIRVGGEIQGGMGLEGMGLEGMGLEDKGLPSAVATYVSEDSELRADALGKGDGGSVVVWADEVAQVYGDISARGGARGGDGGFVETSGKRWLDLHPQKAPDVSAPEGAGGQWLLDPTNISIVNLETPDPSCPAEGCDLDSKVNDLRGFLPDPAVRPEQPEDSTVSAESIKRALLRGAKVTLTTNTRAGAGIQEGDIYVLAEIVISEGDEILQDTVGTLELLAANDVVFTKSIRSETENVVLNLRVVANEAAQRAFDSDPLAGDVLIGVDQNGALHPIQILTQGGSAEFEGVNILTGPAYVDANTGVLISSGDGTTSMRAFDGRVQLDGTIKTDTGPVTIEARRTITQASREPVISITIGGTGSIETGVVPGTNPGEWDPSGETGGAVSMTVAGVGGMVDDVFVEGINVEGSVKTHGGGVLLNSQVASEADTDLDDDDSLNSRVGVTIAALAPGGGPTVVTEGGLFEARGHGQIVIDGAIDTSDPDGGGGNLDLVNLAIVQPDNDVDGRADIEIRADLKTGGGSMTVVGRDIRLAQDVVIDAYDPSDTEDEVDSLVWLRAVGNVDLTGGNTLQSDFVILQSGLIDGVGNISFAAAPVRLAGEDISILAGNGIGGTDDNDEFARIVGIENVAFRNAANEMDSSPESLAIGQDSAITDAQIPAATQFGATTGVDMLRYGLTSSQGNITLSTADKVAGTDLTISGATPPVVSAEINPRSLSVLVASDWEVDSAMASVLRPEDDVETSSLTLHAGTDGTGNLTFDTGVVLQADEIELRAGNGTDDVSGLQSSFVDATTNLPQFWDEAGTGSPRAFSVRQDAAVRSSSRTLADDSSVDFWNVPTSSQLAIVDKAAVDLDYSVRSDDADIEIDAHLAESVENSRLALIADGESELVDNEEIVLSDFDFVGGTRLQVESMEYGKTGSFEVRQELLDAFDYRPDRMNRKITLRAGYEFSSLLSFEDTDPDGTAPGTPPVTVAGDEIRLVSRSTVDAVTNDPIFTAPDSNGVGPDPNAPPGTFVIEQGSGISQYTVQIEDGVLVVDENGDPVQESQLPLDAQFGGGAGPGAVYGLRSNFGAIELQDPMALAGAGADVRAVLSAPEVRIVSHDRLWDDPDSPTSNILEIDYGTGSQLEIRADNVLLEHSEAGAKWYIEATLDASKIQSLTRFDGDDGVNGNEDADFDVANSPPADAPAPAILTVTQDGDLEQGMLPELTAFGSDSYNSDLGRGDEPAMVYNLVSNRGSVDFSTEADYSRVADSAPDVQLGDNPLVDQTVTFIPGQTLNVASFSLASPDPFQFGANTRITSESTINVLAAGKGYGDLSFGSGVELTARSINLQAGDGFTDPPTEPYRDEEIEQFRELELSEETIDELIALRAAQIASEDQEDIEARRSAIVDFSNAPTFNITGDDEDMDGVLDDSLFSIVQDGSIHGGQLPVNSPTSGITNIDALEIYGLDSADGSILMGTGEAGDPDNDSLGRVSDAQNVEMFAQRIELGSTSVLGSPVDPDDCTDCQLSNTTLRANEIVLSARDGVFADIDSFLLANLSSQSFLTRFEIQQQTAVAEGSTLPDRDQFFAGPSNSGPEGVDYFVNLAEYGGSESIQIDQEFAKKVQTSRLVVQAGSGGSVRIGEDGHTEPVFPLILDDLSVNPDENVTGTTTVIGSTTTNPEFDPETGEEIPALTVVFTTFDQNYHDAVEIGEHAFLEGRDLVFHSTVDAQTPDEGTLTVRPWRLADFEGNVGVGARLGTFELSFDREFGATPILLFGEDVSGDIRVETVDDILLNVEGSSDPQTVATIHRSNGNLSFRSQQGRFRMGEGEKLSVVGRLEIRAGDLDDDAVVGVAQIGDLSALEIDVEADIIEFVRRDAGSLWRADFGLVDDGGMDLVANVIRMKADNVGFIGNGRDPVFVVPDPLDTANSLQLELPDYAPEFAVAAFRNDFGPVTGEFFDLEGDPLDLAANGGARGDLTEQYATPVPEPPVGVPPFWLVGDPSPLPTLGIQTRRLTNRERNDRLGGVAIYDDFRAAPVGDRSSAVVAEMRLLNTELDEAIALHRSIFGANGENAQKVREVLRAAIEDYRRETGARRVIGFEFRRYLRNRPNSQFEAHQALEKLDRLFGYHRRSGLAPSEFERIQREWLVDITPEGITQDQLGQAIHPSRYVRGSDILDIFGD